METVKVIVKREMRKGESSLLLFFPESRANYGKIECWSEVGEHSEADQGYYWSLKNPRDGLNDEVEKLLSFYEKRYAVAGPFKLKRVHRDTHQMRCARWAK